jgi:hypothetical protein
MGSATNQSAKRKPLRMQGLGRIRLMGIENFEAALKSIREMLFINYNLGQVLEACLYDCKNVEATRAIDGLIAMSAGIEKALTSGAAQIDITALETIIYVEGNTHTQQLGLKPNPVTVKIENDTEGG